VQVSTDPGLGALPDGNPLITGVEYGVGTGTAASDAEVTVTVPASDDIATWQ
jgi:hypothetical protein